MSKDLIIIGAGASGRLVAEAAGEMANEWNLLGYLDDDPFKQGKEINGVTVLGKIDTIDKYPYSYFIIKLGNPKNRFFKKEFTESLKIEKERYATIIHPEAKVSKYTTIGRGTVIMPRVTVQVNVKIGDHVTINGHAYVGHDVTVEDHAAITTSAAIGGRVRIEEGAFIGINTSIREDLVVGKWSVIGINAAVVNNVPPYEIWAGVPAKFIRKGSVEPA
ncbi:acetyltransferase [Chloroflexota bacterium]